MINKDIRKTDFTRVKSVFLVDANEQDLMRSKRVFEMMNIAEEVFTFRSAADALLNLNRPGLVPEILIVSERMSDTDVRGFMARYENLPEWLKNACSVFQLVSAVSIGDGNDEDFHHALFRGSMRKPFHPHKLQDKCGSIDEFLN